MGKCYIPLLLSPLDLESWEKNVLRYGELKRVIFFLVLLTRPKHSHAIQNSEKPESWQSLSAQDGKHSSFHSGNQVCSRIPNSGLPSHANSQLTSHVTLKFTHIRIQMGIQWIPLSVNLPSDCLLHWTYQLKTEFTAVKHCVASVQL